MHPPDAPNFLKVEKETRRPRNRMFPQCPLPLARVRERGKAKARGEMMGRKVGVEKVVRPREAIA